MQWLQSFRVRLFTLLALTVLSMFVLYAFYKSGEGRLHDQVTTQLEIMNELKRQSDSVFETAETLKSAQETNDAITALKSEFTNIAYRAVVNSYELDEEEQNLLLSLFDALVPRLVEASSSLNEDDKSKLQDELDTFKVTMSRSWFFLNKGQFDMAASMYTVGFESFNNVGTLLKQIEDQSKADIEAARATSRDVAANAAQSSERGFASATAIDDALGNTSVAMLTALVISLVIAAGFSVLIITSIMQQISFITKKIVRVEQSHDLIHALGYSKQDELKPLADSFDRLLASFRTILKSAQEITHDTESNAQSNAELVTTVDEKVYEQHLQLDSAAVALHEMSATARSVAELTANVEGQTSDAAKQAKQSMDLLVRSQDALTSLQGEIEATASTIGELNQATDQIQQVMDIIKAISEQTNLLALNAAIEAARAGENGRGFAVVADEVRTLASKTAASTTDVEKAISSLLEGSGRSVDAMSKIIQRTQDTNSSLAEAQNEVRSVVNAMTTIDAATSQISEAVTEQSTTTESIDANVENVRANSEITKEALATLQQRAQSNVETAKQLQEQIRKFIVD